MELIQAVLETINEVEGGAPESPIFLAFQAQGLGIDEYSYIIGKLTSNGLVERKDHTLSVTPLGRVFLQKIALA